MALTSLVFFVAFITLLFGSIFYHPILGLIGYVLTYVVAPASKWWGVGFAHMGIRYSLFMAAAIGLGMLLQSKKLNFSSKLYGQETLFLLLICWIFLSSYIGLPGYSGSNFAFKLMKVSIFLWMLIRVVGDLKGYNLFIWGLIITTTYIGFDALGASTAQFGRINRGVGGSDFAEGNFLAAHFSMVLPFAGVYFMQGEWRQKLVLSVSSILMINGLILCRSRGSFLALAAGTIAALYWAPKGWRSKIVLLVIVGLIGSFMLMDDGFLRRMGRINTDISHVETQDDSASGRILAWRAALSMSSEYPLGIGQGNFTRYVGSYQPSIPGKDTHNTYFRALAELGYPGLLLIVLMILNAFKILRQQKKRIVDHQLPNKLLLHVYALTVALVIFLVAGMFITETYIEEFYWLLMFPVLLQRVVDHQLTLKQQADSSIGVEPEYKKSLLLSTLKGLG